ncbi:MAG: redox-sensing transcriptional repressor Rex [Anaerolineales bacterium]|jgi:redox-sensing transcriptional repressor|nr:redox-sensing transcriptional repressor Rex [Anaerolineales bacterium]
MELNRSAIPDIVIGRLPKYLRSLQRMAKEGRSVTSSQELGERLGISAAQIRKDLSAFGEFGKQGTGYRIDFLIGVLSEILNVSRIWDVVLVGAGDVGHAISNYQGFENRGFRIAAVFDNDPDKVGTKIGSFTIRNVSEMGSVIRENGYKIAMIAIPASQAQKVADQLVEAGILAILNYAPVSLVVPPNVHVQYNDPVISLQRMTYYLD